MNKTLYVFVEDFSNEKRECFFEKELAYHCHVFDKVYVLSLYPNENKVLKFEASNLEVLYFNYFESCNRIGVFFRNFIQIARIVFFELTHTHSRVFYFSNFRKLINQLVLRFSTAERLEQFINKNDNKDAVFYSYWFRQWVAAFSIIKMKYPALKLVSRVHGGDYDEDQIKSIFPFRYFQLSKVNHIFPVSDFGRNYLIKKFGVPSDHISTSRLGLSIDPLKSTTNTAILHLVSCSYVIELKRVHLIIDILKHINIPCKWTHFGDGPLLETIKEKSKDLKHEVNLKGYVSNSDFITYLQTNPVSLFINVSESEGIPVSMMEAIAHGIPLIGTNVCGVPEIVTERTGFLFPVDFDPESVAQKITDVHTNGQIYNQDFRNGIVDFYKKMFHINNYKVLANQLANV